jgi:hypothetical protein
MVTSALRVLSARPTWELCEEGDQCDKCASAKPSSCRFVVTPQRLVWAAMYSKDDQVPRAVAATYLFGAATKPLGKSSTYESFRELHPEAALRGAVVAARTLRSLHQGSRALVAVKALWSSGLHTPGLTEAYAAIEEDNPSGGALTEALERAKDVCEEGLTSAVEGEDWERVESRLGRLRRRLHRAAQPPPANPRNTRAPHQARFVLPDQVKR